MDRESFGEVSTPTAAARPPRTLRGVSIWSAMLALLTMAGCAIPAPFTRNDFGPSLPANASVEEVVRRVNTNIERLQAWRSNDVRISGQSLPVHLGGQIAVERPRNFRLTAGILGMDEEADFGSNIDWFWFWVKRGNANGQPSYVYQARHEDVPNSQMLSQIPFQPDWLMEALGVVPIDAQKMTLRPEPSGQIVNLMSERLSPSGQAVKKVIRVDLRRGVVLSQSLYDIDGKLIASARLEKHAMDKATGIVLPHLIALEWPQANLQINLEIDHIDVNPTTIPPRNWEVPKKPYYPAFDIGALSRRQMQTAGPADGTGGRADTASAAIDASSAPQGPPAQFGAPSPLAGPGRPTYGPSQSSASWPEAAGGNGSEWNQPIQGPPAASTGQARAANPFDGDPQTPPAARMPAASPARTTSAADPFGDQPTVLGSQVPARPSSGSPGSSSSGSSSGDPFESMPH
jgi:hypothetical protein